MKIVAETIDKRGYSLYNKGAMTRYESNTKTDRNQALRDYRDSHPELSWEEIGKIFSISKQRAYKIYHNGKGESHASKG